MARRSLNILLLYRETRSEQRTTAQGLLFSNIYTIFKTHRYCNNLSIRNTRAVPTSKCTGGNLF